MWFIHCLLIIFFFCNDGNKRGLDSRRRKCLPLLQWCHQHFMQLRNIWSVWFLFFLRVYVIKENVWTDFVPKPLHSPHCQDLCNPENATLCQIVVRRSHNREGMASCRLKPRVSVDKTFVLLKISGLHNYCSFHKQLCCKKRILLSRKMDLLHSNIYLWNLLCWLY